MIDFLNASQAQGITLLGTTGNFLHFDIEEREKLISFGIKRSSKPVAVGVSHSTLDVTIHLCEHAAASGAALALVLPPYYFRYTPAQLEAFFLRVGEKAAQHLPLYLYNIPFFTAEIPVEVSERLLKSGLYSGIKDSSGKPEYLRALKDTGATRLVGNDNALCISRKEGSAGVVSGCAAAVPELICALDAAVSSGNTAREAILAQRLSELISWLDQFPTPVGIEEAARLRKLPARPDLSWLGDSPLDAYRGWFLDWLPQVLSDAKGE